MALPGFPRAWWIEPGRLLGGCYPGQPEPEAARPKLEALLAAGVRRVISLVEPDERAHGAPFVPYAPLLTTLAAARGQPLDVLTLPIRDQDVPSPARMAEILAAIDASPGVVFVHCWGGHGRTGTVAGCWLRRHGASAAEAFAAIREARAHDARLRARPSPETAAQRAFVERWSGPAGAGPAAAPARLRGALLGAAVGDALGTTLEFTNPGPLPWQPALTGPHAELTGGGPFGLAPGQVTDDTQMAACLAAALAEHGALAPGPAALRALHGRYHAWMAAAFDVGNQTRSALAAGARQPPGRGGLAAWLAGGATAAGNGALMRAAPLAGLREPARRRDWAFADAALTHADPRCLLANVAYVEALAVGADGGDTDAMVAAARAGLGEALSRAAHAALLDPADARWAEAAAALHGDLDAAEAADPWLYGEAAAPPGGPRPAAGGLDLLRHAGFVRVAFRLAFWQLRHASGWRAAVVDTVNRGGDADTNGAIVGALLGARHGEGAIPEPWRARVLQVDPPGPWARSGPWHPARLVEP